MNRDKKVSGRIALFFLSMFPLFFLSIRVVIMFSFGGIRDLYPIIYALNMSVIYVVFIMGIYLLIRLITYPVFESKVDELINYIILLIIISIPTITSMTVWIRDDLSLNMIVFTTILFMIFMMFYLVISIIKTILRKNTQE